MTTAPIPVAPVRSGLYFLRETPTVKAVCHRATIDAARALAEARPPPPGWTWAPDGPDAGTPCPSRPGFLHVTYMMTPMEAR